MVITMLLSVSSGGGLRLVSLSVTRWLQSSKWIKSGKKELRLGLVLKFPPILVSLYLYYYSPRQSNDQTVQILQLMLSQFWEIYSRWHYFFRLCSLLSSQQYFGKLDSYKNVKWTQGSTSNETRLGVDKVKPKGWFKYRLSMGWRVWVDWLTPKIFVSALGLWKWCIK